MCPPTSPVDGLPPRVLLTVTKQCMLESKQERIAALERQVEDLMQDRKFLRTHIENLTSSRSMQAFTPPTGEGPRLCSLYRRRRTTAGREVALANNFSVTDYLSDADPCFQSKLVAASIFRMLQSIIRSPFFPATGVQYIIHRYKQVLTA